jgi:ligand-binding sensor domain-containing protein/signal transduction histidine kinase
MRVIQSRGHSIRTRTATLVIVFQYLFSVYGFGLDPAKNLQQYLLRTWTSERGLPQNSIRAILQTRDGFLWIGTLGGLARFDGANFVLYKSGVPDSIPNDSITGLAEDRDGSLWISSLGGLTRYRDGHFHTYGSRDGLPDNSIWRIAADSAGGVWAVTWRSALFHFDGTKVRAYASPIAVLPEEVNALIEDKAGTLWIATFHGLFALDRGQHFTRFTREDGLAGNRVYALSLDRQGQLWSAGDGGLTHHVSDRLVTVPVHGLATATLLAIDPSGRDDSIWTGGTGQGLFRLNAHGVQRLQAAQGLISDELWLLDFSRDGSLWLGAVDGLNQLSDGVVTSYGMGEGLPNSTLRMQKSQGPSGDLWFGEGDTILHVHDGKMSRPSPASADASREKFRRKGAQDPAHRPGILSIWFRSNYRSSRGLVLTDGDGKSVLSDGAQKQPLPRIPWGSVGTILIDRKGMIWTGGSQIGVLAYAGSAPPRSYTTRNGLDDNNVSALAEDADGNIWVGTLSGLNRIRHGIISHIASCAHVTSIDPSADGSLWVSSESGLIYVPRGLTPVRVFTQRDGLPTNVIEGVAEDTLGHLWLGTEQGIVRIDKNELLFNRGSPNGTPAVFGIGDGFRNAQLRVNSIFRAGHGDIWFLTMKELAMIDPRGIQARPLAAVIIDRVDLDDRNAIPAPVQSLMVPPGRHRLTIRYTVPEFRIPNRIRFRYRLDGWDKKWIEAGALRDATYTGIPPGRYTFRVGVSDGYGKWSSVESTLTIKVLPYFYQTIWFSALVALLLIALIWQLHRYRIAQVSARINARMQERTRIARELHDTLLQGMLGVSMQMYALSQQVFADSYIFSRFGYASQRLRELAEQSRMAVENLRSPSSAPGSLETSLALFLRDINLPSGLQPQINSVGTRMELRPMVQIEVEQIAKEAVANAVQHSGANNIRLDIVYQPAHFFLSVSDDGRGIDRETQKSGRHGHWGIPGMRERAISIGGRVRILSNVPCGTVIEISLRGSVAYIEPRRGPIASIWERHRKRQDG